MPSLLFEIGCEELPASACREAEAQLRELWLPDLGEGAVHVGPRRLALFVPEVAEREPDRWVQGPPEHLREQAAAGFARKQGVSEEELEVRDGFLGVVVPGRPISEVLPETLAAIVHGLAFGKSMIWEKDGLRFSRPVRWLCAKLDRHTIHVEVAALQSGHLTYGHRFTGGEVELPRADEYAEVLRAAGVEPDQEERRRQILEGLDAIGGWRDPAGVLEEVVFLVESPIVLQGRFDERFLDLPPRVVETAMQSHQRYLPLEGARFAFVANGGDPEVVVAGNERVLEGRLEDAHFSFERDVRKGIEALAEQLGAITFVAGAGSFADKAARLQELVGELGGGEASREAARLAKADQAAELVREFPDLEGHIGAEYARLAGFPEAVCAAIDEQYLPDSADGPLPHTEPGRVLAAAEKVDNLAVAFALGQRPTGSRDPHGLRRAAIGLCRIAVEGGLEIDVAALVQRDLGLLVQQEAELADDPADVPDFVFERLEGILDVPVEFVRAARAGGVGELGAVADLARTLAAEASSAEFGRAYVAFDRSNRLAGRADGAAGALDPALATDEAEVALIEALGRASPRIEAAIAERDFRAAIAAAAELGPPVDRFFDDVLVMAEDERVRANRLRLLLDVRDAVGALGDLSQIPR
ncbi:MAG TPA: glycine--tRNA ligase subunit beta [Gaiellaceae bacterium]|nr:glycine--tRNA ligase subunit beta [Gaiellaceae bacterium]